jgi:hypothetical protein
MNKEDIVYICLAVFGGALSAITTLALKLHVKTFNICCNVISFTRSQSSRFRLSLFSTSKQNSSIKEISPQKYNNSV